METPEIWSAVTPTTDLPEGPSQMAARIEELESHVRVALPSAYPYRKTLVSTAGRIAAQGP